MRRFIKLALALTALLLLLAAFGSTTTLLAQEHQPQQQQQHQAAAPHAGEHSGGGEHGNDLSTWKWVNFGILFALLAYMIARKAGPFFTARIAEIQKDINEAKSIKADAEARAAAIEQRLANLEGELASIRTDAKREMEAEAARIQDETRKAAARAEEQVQVEIASLSKAAENSLRAEASRLALELAEKKLKARMTPETNGSLVGRFVAGLRQVSAQQQQNNN